MLRTSLKILKRIGLSLLLLILITILALFLFLKLSPQFGGQITQAQKAQFELLPHYKDGIFINAEPFEIKTDCHSVEEMIKKALRGNPHGRPSRNIEVVPFNINTLNQIQADKTRITWLGHSSFLLEINGKIILIDPIFSTIAAPHQWIGQKRYNEKMPFKLDSLKHIDAIVISHDHYDHLDYLTIKKLREITQHVFVPLGVGNHFRRWDYEEKQITEMDWWQETSLDSLQIVLTPSRHASGRALSDQSSTLWGSWCFINGEQRVYFSGDGGYGQHFKAIGEKYGPFDFAMVECGQYDELWEGMHMMPEESVQAGMDVEANCMMPIHWGAFTLANHSWTEPVERFSQAALQNNVNFCTPQIGQSVLLNSDEYPRDKWWELFD